MARQEWPQGKWCRIVEFHRAGDRTGTWDSIHINPAAWPIADEVERRVGHPVTVVRDWATKCDYIFEGRDW